jgi:hypothetical protein
LRRRLDAKADVVGETGILSSVVDVRINIPCTSVRLALPEPFMDFMHGHFHGLELRRLQIDLLFFPGGMLSTRPSCLLNDFFAAGGMLRVTPQ